jgi:hypothetical protein
VQKTTIVLSRTASGHDGCTHEYHLAFGGGGGVAGKWGVTEILEGLVWRRRSEWADGRKRVPWNVRRHSINPLTPELNPFAQRCVASFLLGILLLEPCISLIYA